MSEDDAFDGTLMGIVQRTGGIDGFFDAMFGFLRRKTDFYANQKEAEGIIVKHSHEQFKKYAAKKKSEEEAARKKKDKEDMKKKYEQPMEREHREPPRPPKQPSDSTEEGKKEEKEERRGLPGNGGSTDKYTWTQTLEELHVYILVHKDLKKQDLIIKLDTTHCFVSLKGQTPIIDADWPERIRADDSLWTLEDAQTRDLGRYIHLTVNK